MTTFFRHYKNRYYQIVGEALDTRDDTLVVVYRTLYPSEYSLFTRPKEEFFGSVRCPDGSECLRFTPVEYAELPEDARSRVVHEVEIWRQRNCGEAGTFQRSPSRLFPLSFQSYS